MKRIHFLLLPIWLAGPAQAGWTQKDYASEYDGCLSGCDKNNPQEHEKCVKYCRCLTEGMQTQFPNHDELVRQPAHGKLPERVAGLQRLADHCNHQIWGNPARKLKFH